MDIGNPDDIHPTNKQEVGKRLALWALAKDYEKESVFSGPLFKEMQILRTEMEYTVKLDFDYSTGGLVAKGPLTYFELAGDDRQFYPAKAKIDGEHIYLTCDQVPDPVAVRFAFSNTAEPRLYNQAGLPASPFRTDDWPLVFTYPTIETAYSRQEDVFTLNLSFNDPDAKLHYTVDGTIPNETSPLYAEKVRLAESAEIQTIAYKAGIPVSLVAKKEVLRHAGLVGKIVKATKPNASYPGMGEYTLLDGLIGSSDFFDPEWQGFEDEDVEITIDLGKKTKLNRVAIRLLQAQGSWIFFPCKAGDKRRG